MSIIEELFKSYINKRKKIEKDKDVLNILDKITNKDFYRITYGKEPETPIEYWIKDNVLSDLDFIKNTYGEMWLLKSSYRMDEFIKILNSICQFKLSKFNDINDVELNTNIIQEDIKFFEKIFIASDKEIDRFNIFKIFKAYNLLDNYCVEILSSTYYGSKIEWKNINIIIENSINSMKGFCKLINDEKYLDILENIIIELQMNAVNESEELRIILENVKQKLINPNIFEKTKTLIGVKLISNKLYELRFESQIIDPISKFYVFNNINYIVEAMIKKIIDNNFKNLLIKEIRLDKKIDYLITESLIYYSKGLSVIIVECDEDIIDLLIENLCELIKKKIMNKKYVSMEGSYEVVIDNLISKLINKDREITLKKEIDGLEVKKEKEKRGRGKI